MPERDAKGRILPGSAKVPGSGLQKDAPLTVFRKLLKRKPLPGELDRMIEAFDIPEDAAAEIRLCENGMEAMVMLAIHRAHSGSWDAWREIMDRVAPKPKAVEVSGPGGAPMQTVSLNVGADDAAQLYQQLLGGDIVDAEFEEEENASISGQNPKSSMKTGTF